MTKKPENTAEYLATLSDDQRKTLGELRDTIVAAAPEAEEGFSYGMPLLRLHGTPLVWYAAWKQHYSLYPIGESILRSVDGSADGYETSKGTIRFPAKQPLPHDLVTKLVQARIAEVREKGEQGGG